MKIKEVITQTGLTDRAIRLYIENGLLSPKNCKSYTGRNSYDFSDADAELLGQIALLRKADFSLEQIKALQAGGEAARAVLQDYLNNRQAVVMRGQRVLKALKDFPADLPVTVETVCVKLRESMADQTVPEADTQPSKGEIWEKRLMLSIAAVYLFLAGRLGIDVWRTYQEDFVFPKFYKHPVNYIGMAYILIPIIMSLVVFILYRKPVYTKEHRKRRGWIAGISLGIAIVVSIQPIGSASLMLMPPVYSQTTDPGNYLVLGTYTKMYGEDIYKLFPANIPRSAVAKGSRWYPPDKFPETTKYYYYYQDVIDPSFQLYAEWVLPEDEFAEELARFRSYYPEGPKQQVQWGDWTCMSFTDDTLDWNEAKDEIYYYYLIFAYNESTGGVRYIASYCMDSGREEDPYFLELEW